MPRKTAPRDFHFCSAHFFLSPIVSALRMLCHVFVTFSCCDFSVHQKRWAGYILKRSHSVLSHWTSAMKWQMFHSRHPECHSQEPYRVILDLSMLYWNIFFGFIHFAIISNDFVCHLFSLAFAPFVLLAPVDLEWNAFFSVDANFLFRWKEIGKKVTNSANHTSRCSGVFSWNCWDIFFHLELESFLSFLIRHLCEKWSNKPARRPSRVVRNKFNSFFPFLLLCFSDCEALLVATNATYILMLDLLGDQWTPCDAQCFVCNSSCMCGLWKSCVCFSAALTFRMFFFLDQKNKFYWCEGIPQWTRRSPILWDVFIFVASK